MSRSNRPIASDLLQSGWLPPKAAAAALGITERQLEARAHRGEIKRKQLVPNSRIYLYEVAR
jgi:hypothetical protein